MNDKKLLEQIEGLFTKNLDPIREDLKGVNNRLSGVEQDLKGVKKQLDSVEIKVELVNERVGQTQETIDVLSELINEGYNLHEKRIKKLEEHLQSSQA